MFNITRLIYDELKAEDPDLKIFTEEREDRSEVWLQFGIDNGGSYRIRFINTEDNNEVAVRVFGIASIAKDQIPRILPVINQLNAKYRFAKLVCDNDGDINLSYDFFAHSIHPEKCAMEVLVRVVDIIDDVYPAIMRALWG